MAEMVERKEREPFSRRVFCPAGVALGVWVLLNVMTSHLEWFGSGHAYRAAAAILYPMLGITIALSSLFVYSVLYVRGASTKERIFWACLVPFTWVMKEIWRVSAFFSLGESFYYALSPSPLGVLGLQLGCLCLCEIFWRWRDKKRGRSIRIITPGPLVGLNIFAFLIYFILLWGSAGDTPGTKWFYLYMEGYKALFVK
jgi:hypothetical protein